MFIKRLFPSFVLGFLAITTSVAQAQVLEADDNIFGPGALTRDTVLGLDFLDVTLTLGRSVDDVSSEFGVGGEFEDFRYATSSEVANLVNNYGFSPGAAGSYPIFVAGDLGIDQLSGLVTLLGVTANTSSPASRLVQGKADTVAGCAVPVINIRDFTGHPTLGDDDTFQMGACTNTSSTTASLGNYLVRQIPDSDLDGIFDYADNCPAVANSSQSNIDGDSNGDLCDVCPADDTDTCDPNGSAADEVTVADGGTVSTPDGQLDIVIDPGDLSGDTTISATETTFNDPEVNLSIGANSGAGQAIAFYDLEPDGLNFANAVTLNIMADVSGLNASRRDKIDLYRLEDTDMDGTPETFVSLAATCSVVEDPIGTFIATCTVQVDHFSTYAIVVPLDSDGDGVPDNFDGVSDVCPSENATGFDVDNDGCIDSFNGLIDLVAGLVIEGVITSNMENSLLSKVSNAQSSSDRENVCTAINELDAFKNQVAAQTGKKISPDAASLVIEYADSVILYLQNQLPSGDTC